MILAQFSLLLSNPQPLPLFGLPPLLTWVTSVGCVLAPVDSWSRVANPVQSALHSAIGSLVLKAPYPGFLAGLAVFVHVIIRTQTFPFLGVVQYEFGCLNAIWL